LRRALLSWFRRHARVLPWRRSRDPYAIWVSEVMLQQTQVVTVERFFSRFLERFPSVEALARAREQDVLKLWEGLGYYRRARNLLQAARILSRAHAGILPDDLEIVRGLPGFGRYTANAVLSQAYDRRLPIIEANSRRVLCRLFGIQNTGNATERRLWHLAESLLPLKKVGDFNQALMELGALVCTPRQPDCQKCPLRGGCRARQMNRQESMPGPSARQVIEEQDEVAVVCRRGDRVLIVQRPNPGRWGGLWEFPHGPRQKREAPARSARRILGELGLVADVGQELVRLRHGVTRFRIQLVCLEARHCEGEFHSTFYQRGRWLCVARLSQLPFSSPQRRVAACLTL
jgi:A/G-specific adenine glycosylase